MKQHSIYFIHFFCILTVLIFFVGACKSDSSSNQYIAPPPKPKVEVPVFDADLAYSFTKKQTEFGTRVPGTAPHKACADWLAEELKSYTPAVIVQSDTVKSKDGAVFPMYNIIASFEPENKKRILLAAHWDTRRVADKDTKDVDKPIEGANDGASGVGVLLEIARLLSTKSANIGVDIVLFDVEDQGLDGVEDSYALGSQYWSKNPHKVAYTAEYGILLDMVGAADAIFLQEVYSLNYAKSIVNKVWNVAHELGYKSYFPKEQGGAISDDHYYVNQIAKIPMIDVIHYTKEGGFGKFHHTHDDDMGIISKSTLKAVGQTVLTVIYRENPPSLQ